MISKVNLSLLLISFFISAKAQNINTDFIFPESSNKKLDQYKVQELASDSQKLLYAKNEIFARKGHIFKDPKFTSFFATKKWYEPRAEINIYQLNGVERYNVNLIKYFEEHPSGLGFEKENNLHPHKQNNKIYEEGEIAYIDLNGDGTKERITYQSSTLTINTNSIKVVGGPDFMYDLNSFVIVDIDKRDSYKEIILSSNGPSDDQNSTIYYYDGKYIKQVIKDIGGTIKKINIDGSGIVNAVERGSILQTWWFPVQHKLSPKHTLIKVSKSIYPTDYEVFIQQSIKVFIKKNSKSNSFALSEGEIVKIIGTDNKKWCLIETSTGKKGWFFINDDTTIGNEKLVDQVVFLGLCKAD